MRRGVTVGVVLMAGVTSGCGVPQAGAKAASSESLACESDGLAGSWRSLDGDTMYIDPDCTGYRKRCELRFKYEESETQDSVKDWVVTHSTREQGCPSIGERFSMRFNSEGFLEVNFKTDTQVYGANE